MKPFAFALLGNLPVNPLTFMTYGPFAGASLTQDALAGGKGGLPICRQGLT